MLQKITQHSLDSKQPKFNINIMLANFKMMHVPTQQSEGTLLFQA